MTIPLAATLANGLEKAFFGPVFAALPITSVGAVGDVAPAIGGVEAWARGIVKSQLAAVGFPNASLATIQAFQAIGRLEGFYGKAATPKEWAGSNNWGAVQCCKSDSEGKCPPNTFASKDFDPKTQKTYPICFKSYPTPEAGCLDMMKFATKTQAEKDAFMKGDLLAIATAMYDAHYYGSPYPERDKAIAYYAGAMDKNVKAICKALGEVQAATIGSVPSGESGIASLLPIALGLGVLALKLHGVGLEVITGDSLRAKMMEVDAKMSQTGDEYSKAIGKKKIPLDRYVAWTKFYKRWTDWYQANEGTAFFGLTERYKECEEYDLQRYEYAKALEKIGAVDRPAEIKPVEPGGPDNPNNPSTLKSLTDLAWPVTIAGIVWFASGLLKR